MHSREAALNRLRTSSDDEPVGVTNVGIFGEGIDTPALNAVAFIEARKSPVDVIQAVGRAMRLSPEKEFGYIIVPLEIPPGKDPEAWLESRENDDGYKELAQILVALRAHDGRIEDSLAQMLRIHVPDDEEEHEHLVTVATPNGFDHALVTCPARRSGTRAGLADSQIERARPAQGERNCALGQRRHNGVQAPGRRVRS